MEALPNKASHLPTDVICGSNLVSRAEQALAADTLLFGRFVELCTLLEALVLADHIHYFGAHPVRGRFAQNFPQVFTNWDSATLSEIVSAPAFEAHFQMVLKQAFGPTGPYLSPVDVTEVGQKRRMDDDVVLAYRCVLGESFPHKSGEIMAWLAEQASSNGGSSVEFRYLCRTFLYESVARFLHFSSAHDGLRLPLASVTGLRTVHINFRLYETLTSALKPIALRGSSRLFVRPIPAVVLARCQGDRGALIQKVAELRQQFSGFREAALEYETICDSDLPLAEKERYRQLFADALNQLQERAHGAKQTTGGSSNVLSLLLKSLQGGKKAVLLEGVRTALNSASKWRSRKTLASLFDLFEEYMTIKNNPDFLQGLWPSTPFARGHAFHKVLESCPIWIEEAA
jgi:hypothetical protein